MLDVCRDETRRDETRLDQTRPDETRPDGMGAGENEKVIDACNGDKLKGRELRQSLCIARVRVFGRKSERVPFHPSIIIREERDE